MTKFSDQFLTNAVSPNGVGLQQAIRLLEEGKARPDLIVRARAMLAEQRRAALRAEAAREEEDMQLAA